MKEKVKFSMATADFGFISYVPRLKAILTEGLKNYFDDGVYDEALGDVECYGCVDYVFPINDFAVFTFERQKEDDDEGDEVNTNLFDITLRQIYPGQISLWSQEFCATRFYNPDGMTTLSIPDFVEEILPSLITTLNKYKDLRKVPICSSCQNLGSDDGKEFCRWCRNRCCYYGETCSICLNDEDKVSVWVSLKKCGHIFHSKCVSRLFENKPDAKPCPLCRSEFHFYEKKIL